MSAEGEAIFSEVERDIQSNDVKIEKIETNHAPTADGKMLSPIFRMLADGVAPNWNVTDPECESVGEATEIYINDTWGGLDNVPSWVSLLLAIGMVVVPRLGTPLRIEEKTPGDNSDNKDKVDK